MADLTPQQIRERDDRKKRRTRALAILLLLMGGVTAYGSAQAELWAAGAITSSQFANNILANLGAAHAAANHLARYSAGSINPLDDSDQAVGDLMIADQSPFMARFARDLERGRYGTPAGTDIPAAEAPEAEPPIGLANVNAIETRLDLYTERLRGTVNAAVIAQLAGLFLGSGEGVYWELEPGAAHCGDCLAMAEGSPWALSELEFLPGDGSTQCGPNCKCSLLYLDEPISF